MLDKRLHIFSRDFFKACLAIVPYHGKKNDYGAPPTIHCPRSAVAAGHMAKIALNMLLSRQILHCQLSQYLMKRFYTSFRMRFKTETGLVKIERFRDGACKTFRRYSCFL